MKNFFEDPSKENIYHDLHKTLTITTYEYNTLSWFTMVTRKKKNRSFLRARALTLAEHFPCLSFHGYTETNGHAHRGGCDVHGCDSSCLRDPCLWRRGCSHWREPRSEGGSRFLTFGSSRFLHWVRLYPRRILCLRCSR